MPLGPYKDFAACVADQQKKGKSADSAKKICGEIEKKSNAAMDDDDAMKKCMASQMKKGMSSSQAKKVCMDMMEEEGKKDWRKLNFNIPIQEVLTEGETDIKNLTIRGLAINETTTRNGVTYLAEELSPAATSFRDKPILKDHTNSVDSIVGRTTENVHFDQSIKAIRFEAKIMDQKMKEMISDGRIKNVSIGAMVKDIEETESSEGNKMMIARGIEGVEISLVAVPADKNANFAQAMMESFELKRKGIVQIEDVREEKMAEKVSDFGSQEEYQEYLALKEQKKEQEIREKVEKELKEKMEIEPQSKGKVTKTKEETLAESLSGYLISSQDDYSRGNFLTRWY